MHRKSKYDRIRFFTYQGKQINGDINLNRNFIKSIHNRSEISEKWILADNESANLIKKITEGNGTLGEISSIVKGSETGKNSVFTIDSEVISEFNIEQEVIKPCVKNSDIYQYVIRKDDKYIIYADKKMLTAILINLLNNSIKFSEIEKRIFVKAKEIDNQIELLVEDEGVGIPNEFKESLFDLPIGHSATGTQNEKGTGLGLILIHEFAKIMNTEINLVKSDKSGTTFSVKLLSAK
jgi:K+-sensing histidine kinase KdpD